MTDRVHDCSRPGCGQRATCTPVLVVPPSRFARTYFEGVRAVFWLPLCQRHFSDTSIREFMNGDAMVGVEQSITRDFTRNGSIPDFAAAQVQSLDHRTNEFAHYEQTQHDLREGAVLPAQTRH